jgi:hypothetical protein
MHLHHGHFDLTPLDPRQAPEHDVGSTTLTSRWGEKSAWQGHKLC